MDKSFADRLVEYYGTKRHGNLFFHVLDNLFSPGGKNTRFLTLYL